MKKLLIAALMLFGYISSVNAAGVNIGLSFTGGVFDVDGAAEKFSGAHSSSASPGNVVKKASDEGDEAEGLFGIGSIFIEKTLTDRLAVGLDFVPHSMDTETTENTQKTTTSSATGTNTVQVDFEDLTTIYATLALNDNLYAKVGHVSVDVITNESLATGGSYGDTDLDGYTLALGYNRDLDTGAFLRFEASYMDLDGATLTNTADSTKSVTADGITGYGARLSVGRSF
tara:strand:- start:7 stop:693 length:687 start_codon:yes stop_codon:yes gene_type:complete